MGADARLGSICNHLNSGRPRAYVPSPNGSRGARVKIIICSLILAAFLWLVRAGLDSALAAYGFWPYMIICSVSTGIIVAAAFAWDWYEARR
jgi:hypothetical protein